MSADNILTAASRIAAKLETLPEINEAFPYAKPISAIQLGDLDFGAVRHFTAGDARRARVSDLRLVLYGETWVPGLTDVDGGQELQNGGWPL